jgi:CheY-like chemotaxis protein
MSQEVQQKVFDPFFTTKEFSSSGLGLSVSYGIISRHGGEILVESEEGEGTVFTIKLPLSERKDVETVSEIVSEVHKSASVLIIDDEKGILDALSDSLSAMGHKVRTAVSGSKGLEMFKEMKYDVVFTDLGMPDMNGWEVARAIKQISPKTPVAMVTGWHMELKEDKMKKEGVDLVITKPFEMDNLQRVMAEALALKSKM